MCYELDKKDIKPMIDALREFGIANGLPQESLAEGAGVNVSYINAMLNNRTYVGSTKIADVHFRKVAEYIGYKFDKVYWKHRDIDEYVEVYTQLADAKAKGNMKIIINTSGFGKTYTSDRFKKENVRFTYRVTVSSLHRLQDILEELADALGITNLKKSQVARLKQIASKLRTIKLSGGKPIIILDESENLKLPSLKMLKALYDAICEYCPIVLIGTEDLIRLLDKLLENKETGMPQFYRRWKSGIYIVKSREKDEVFAPFLEDVHDSDLRDLLCSLCDNIGELHDYLEPAMRAADEMGEELTESFFRSLYNL